jgi:hypothetical protein
MKRFLPVAALLALAGCGVTTAQTTTASNAAITTVAGAEIALTAADTVATKYITQPLCPKGVVLITCSDPATASSLKSYGQKASDVLKQAQAGTATLAAAVAALNAFTAATPISTTPPATTP